MLADRPAWYVVGPLMGLVIVALFATINERLGVMGGYSDVVERIAGRSRSLGWKAFFLFGIVVGGALFAVLGGTWRGSEGYGWLSRTVDDDRAVAAVLLSGGVLIGLGAKTAGGCTSGHGLSGSSFGSPASILSTMTFMAAAVGTAFLARVALG